MGVGDAGEDELGLKEREEAVGRGLAPAGAGLGEVLEADEDVEVLSAAFGDERGEIVDRCDVRDLVEAEEHGRVAGVLGGGGGVGVGGVMDLLLEPDDERCAEGLAVRGRGDVDRVGGVHEPVGVEVGVGGRDATGTGRSAASLAPLRDNSRESARAGVLSVFYLRRSRASYPMATRSAALAVMSAPGMLGTSSANPTTKCVSSALASRRSVCTVVGYRPLSMREMAEWLVPMRLASSAWLSLSWPRRRITIRASASNGARRSNSVLYSGLRARRRMDSECGVPIGEMFFLGGVMAGHLGGEFTKIGKGSGGVVSGCSWWASRLYIHAGLEVLLSQLGDPDVRGRDRAGVLAQHVQQDEEVPRATVEDSVPHRPVVAAKLPQLAVYL